MKCNAMRVLCANSMPYVAEAFATLGDPVLQDGRQISPADVRDAEILAIRSTTRVDRTLLEGSRVRFVGTATIGTDHLDVPYLAQRGIEWCYAPGCNATSVSEYIIAALLLLANRHSVELEGKTLGVIGVGNVGSRLVHKAERLGLRVLQNDPPRQAAEGGSHWVSLDHVLAEADIISLHVPLTAEGDHATFHMANSTFFSRMKPGAVFLNSSRGSVVETDALLAAIDAGRVGHTVIDTWEGEPVIRQDLVARVDIGTPHIAGYSFDGKVAGTVMVYEAAARFLGVEPAWDVTPLLPPPSVPKVSVAAGRRQDAVLHDVVRRVYDIEQDDHALRDVCEGAVAEHFDRLRNTYRQRREFSFTSVHGVDVESALGARVAGLGFNMETQA